MKKYVVISHTHWDREWYMPFELFRLRLVDLIDRLLDILEKDPEYIFHLDAQTVVLEDYLVIRPENEEKLKNYITSGNVIVGPWYLQSDFYLTDGESTIRNLQYGTEIAERFGACSKVGYAPDQFGNVSQLPQLLGGFGIDNFVFGRGYEIYEKDENGNWRDAPAPVQFIWRGADGTECIAVCMKRWYNNAQHIPEETEYAKILLDINEKFFTPRSVTPHILLMNGVDHLEAQGDLTDIISRLKREGIDIEQTTLDKFIADVKSFIRENGSELTVFEGALNKGHDYSILKGCWSSRIYLKQANVAAMDLLENKLEPLWTYLCAKGAADKYPQGEFNYMWKNLLKNHPHDSICGCSRDEVHAHMEDSFARNSEIGLELLRRGMCKLSAHVQNKLRDDKNYMITVFNGNGRALSSVVRATIDFLSSEGVEKFSLVGANGESVPYTVIQRSKEKRDVFSPVNLPGVLDVDRVVIEFKTCEIGGLSAYSYAVILGEDGECLTAEKGDFIENESYKIYFDGGVCILNKNTNKLYKNAVQFEDSADRGDSYVYQPYGQNTLYNAAEGEVLEVTPFSSKIKFTYKLNFPKYFDFENSCRSNETVPTDATVTLTLNNGYGVIGVEYSFINGADDHRTRLLFNLDGNRLITDSPFDYAEKHSKESCPYTNSDTHHASTFALCFGGDGDAAIYNLGQYENELVDGGLAVTVLRATGWINRGDNFEPGGGVQWFVPGNQSHREMSGRLGLDLCPDLNPCECLERAKAFRCGLISHGDSFDAKKYLGGRFALQTAELDKFYYVPDPCEGVYVDGSLVEVKGENVAITCVKRGLSGDVAVRMVNFSTEKTVAEIKAEGEIFLTDLAEKSKQSIGKDNSSVALAPKKIATLSIKGVNRV